MKCAPDIAGLLARLACYRRIKDPVGCLPTGSPLSPLLSIYANKPMFDALDFLAIENGLKFTCYVDDLTFSGAGISFGFGRRVASLVKRSGHRLADDKTRFFGKGVPKHITGVVVQNGRVTVPFGRFKKARRIEAIVSKTTDHVEKLRLMQKLSGLLGEAAFLDARYQPWAQNSYRKLEALRRTPVVTYSGVVLSLKSRSAPVLDTPMAKVLEEGGADFQPPWSSGRMGA